MQNAQRAQFLEGDIRLAQQFTDLDKQVLNRNQEQIDFNKKMLTANNIINATQAAVGLTNAAVGISKAIGEYNDHKANLSIQTDATRYQAGVTEAITNGYDPYVVETGKDGQLIRRYIGYDNYTLSDGTTLGDLKKQAIETVGNKYWTNSGAERGIQIATNAFENIELAAQRQTAEAVIRNRQDVFNQELTNAMNAYAQSGDRTQLNTVLNGASSWMTPDERQSVELSVERQANFNRTRSEAISIARSRGHAEALSYVNNARASGLIDDTNRETILGDIGQEISVSQRALNDEIQRRITSNSNMSPRNSYNSLMRYAGEQTDPQARRIVEDAARQELTNRLNKRYNDDLVQVQSGNTSLEQLKNIRDRYAANGLYQYDYGEQSDLQRTHLQAFNSLVSNMERDSSSSSSLSTLQREAENIVSNIESRFHNNDLSGNAAILALDAQRSLTPKADEAIARILGTNITNNSFNPATQSAYRGLTALLDANKPKSNASADEKYQYEVYSQRIREAIYQEYFNGVRDESFGQLIEKHRIAVASDILQTVFSRGNLGNSGFFTGLFGVSADEAATALAYHGNRGNIDLYFYNPSRDPRNPDQTISDVGGERYNQILNQATDNLKGWMNNELRNKGIQIIHGEPERDASGDRSGGIIFTGSDGNAYRVNSDSEKGRRYMEKWDGGQWRRFDHTRLPNAPAPVNSSYNEREASILATSISSPMPPEFTGNRNDVQSRRRFILEYGVDRYKQFIGWDSSYDTSR